MIFLTIFSYSFEKNSKTRISKLSKNSEKFLGIYKNWYIHFILRKKEEKRLLYGKLYFFTTFSYNLETISKMKITKLQEILKLILGPEKSKNWLHMERKSDYYIKFFFYYFSYNLEKNCKNENFGIARYFGFFMYPEKSINSFYKERKKVIRLFYDFSYDSL